MLMSGVLHVYAARLAVILVDESCEIFQRDAVFTLPPRAVDDLPAYLPLEVARLALVFGWRKAVLAVKAAVSLALAVEPDFKVVVPAPFLNQRKCSFPKGRGLFGSERRGVYPLRARVS